MTEKNLLVISLYMKITYIYQLEDYEEKKNVIVDVEIITDF